MHDAVAFEGVIVDTPGDLPQLGYGQLLESFKSVRQVSSPFRLIRLE
jgi:hypothetical protein